MTRYAIDDACNALVASWSTGIGDAAAVVTELPRTELDRQQLRRLAADLTALSQLCWRSYTHPASAADQHGPDSVGRRRQQERDAFATVLPLLIDAGQAAGEPVGTKVGRAAQAVARTLRSLDTPQLTTQIAADVATELAAVEQAELGDLSDRAEQAVALSREDASPLQISQADTLLRADPFGCPALLTQIDPAAAAVAAAHWFHAAVTVAARQAGLHPIQVVASAEQHGKPLAVESLTEIASFITAGGRPRHVVMPLIRTALNVGEGHLRGITGLHERVTAARELLDKTHTDHPDLDLSPDTVHVPLTPLNPARPAPDLLDNLLNGMQTCWHTYQHSRRDELPREQLRHAFLTAVRQEAHAQGERLL